MTRILTCPSGHRWEIKPSRDPGETVTLVCPVCGGAGHETESQLPKTIADAAANSDAKTVNTNPPPGSSARTEVWAGDATPGDSASNSHEPLPAARLSVPGYEIFTELGRGGMGVVYKAKHVSLNRIVALKMILAGAHASPQELARFKTEAEAVAQMIHTNIVQIFHIDQHEGLPFFSLEYVEGGSLAQKLNGVPMPGREAAQLVETLARAVHAAHQRGIIHRDLKPANVLLAADGTPKITDFGLAKKIETEGARAGNTRSGTIMGTPSYMAPEQAGDKEKQIGPHTDVYALGSILYEMLTGRPPFKCENPLDTVLQVLDHEPEPPRSLEKSVDPSLEAICLKCLEKNPRDRYARASDLADDLRAYLNGEPVKADRSTSLRLFRLFLRETRHTEVMALWGKVWMAHAVIMLVLLLTTAALIPFFQYRDANNNEVTKPLPYGLLWVLGIVALAVPIWWFRFRPTQPASPGNPGGPLPLTLIERQMGQIWLIFTIGFVLTTASQYYAGGAAYLEIKSLLPLVMIEFGLAFGCMSVILGGSFYGMALTCLVMGLVQTAVSRLGDLGPALGVALFGVIFFVGLYLPGRKYSRAAIKAPG